MNPSSYVPAYLELLYATEHPELTDAAHDLVRERIEQDPERYATTPHARALVSYMRVHEALAEGMRRMDDLPDEEFERKRAELFEQTRSQLAAICAADEYCIDAQLVSIQLAEVPLDACIADMLRLERHTRAWLIASKPGFDPDAEGLFQPLPETLGVMDTPARTAGDPDIIGWLHVVEALSQGCIFTARYRAAAEYARTVLRAAEYPSYSVGTLLLALARLEDEAGFFEVARAYGDEVEDLPWYLLARTLLLYKLGQRRSARRALRDFATRCDGGAFFLLNPTYHNPYLPVRPEAREPWNLSHQAVWEADGIISDTPDFTLWAEGVEGVREAAEAFAQRQGF